MGPTVPHTRYWSWGTIDCSVNPSVVIFRCGIGAIILRVNADDGIDVARLNVMRWPTRGSSRSINVHRVVTVLGIVSAPKELTAAIFTSSSGKPTTTDGALSLVLEDCHITVRLVAEWVVAATNEVTARAQSF